MDFRSPLVVIGVWLAMTGTRDADAQPVLTGRADLDFAIPGAVAIPDPGGKDVEIPDAYPPGTVSGLDIETVHVWLAQPEDGGTLYVGIQTFGIAGDVDGDGHAGQTGPEMSTEGGIDYPNFAVAEMVAITLDLDEDGEPDVVLGIPPGIALAGANLFVWKDNPIPGEEFGDPIGLYPADVAFSPNADKPHLEFTVPDFSTLLGDYNQGLSNPTQMPIAIGVELISLAAGGIGHDVLAPVAICVGPCQTGGGSSSGDDNASGDDDASTADAGAGTDDGTGSGDDTNDGGGSDDRGDTDGTDGAGDSGGSATANGVGAAGEDPTTGDGSGSSSVGLGAAGVGPGVGVGGAAAAGAGTGGISTDGVGGQGFGDGLTTIPTPDGDEGRVASVRGGACSASPRSAPTTGAGALFFLGCGLLLSRRRRLELG